MADSTDTNELRAERDALEARVEQLEARPERRRKTRVVFTAILLILAILCFTVAVPGLWARRTVFNTENYVDTVAPLASDPAVQEYLARTITEEVFTALNVEDRLRETLQQRDARLAFLAGPIADGVRGVVQSQLQKILASDAFQQTWASLNRTVQVQIVAVLANKSSSFQIQDNAVVLNVLPLINEGLGSISSTISDLVGHQITLPTITADTIPSAAVQQLQSALGVTLPTDFGSIVVYRSDSIKAVQDVVNLAQRAIILLAALFLLFTAIALWASPHRRRTLLQLATALLAILIVERRLAIWEANSIIMKATPENQAAARAVVDRVLGSLLWYTAWFLAVALIVLIVSLLTGPYPWAVKLRGWTVDMWRAGVTAVRGHEASERVTWVAAHRDPLMVGGAVVAALLLFFGNLSLWWFLFFAIVIGAYELIVYRVAEREHAIDPTDPATPPAPGI
ncbi:MAG TPA: hypothetical protein VJ736_10010 [Actinomycetota bacterium]|nr:hypothetical protein [Actinomycetota bacterium]